MTTKRAANAADEEKFRELLLYIIKKTEFDKNFGATKLNKALFFTDMLAHGKLGKSVTGQEYQKLEHGPAPRQLVPIRARMIEDEDCVFLTREHHGFTQKRLVAKREPRLDLFTGEEIAIADEVIDLLDGLTGKQVSEFSHDLLDCWNKVPIGETLPLDLVFVANRPLTAGESRHAMTITASSRGD